MGRAAADIARTRAQRAAVKAARSPGAGGSALPAAGPAAGRLTIHRAESSAAQQDWGRAWSASQITLFTARRGFLPGDDLPWIAEIRHELDSLHVRALEAYAEASLNIAGTELATAERSARDLVARAPFRESGYRVLMAALAARGNTAEALRVYDGLMRLLSDEFGVIPSQPTRNLHAQLLRSQSN